MDIINELELAYGNHFEDLFSKLMKLKYQIISTSGRTGDMKVDGVLNYEIAFAVYAPEVYKEENVVQKLKSDFNGFMLHKKNGDWSYIRQYCFVIKRERSGITPKVGDLLASFNQIFPVLLVTMDDLKMIEKYYLPFSEDGYLLEEFKSDVTYIMEYIIETDFSAEPFDINLADEICSILGKWSKKKYSFRQQNIENLKNKICQCLGELCQYLSPVYMHYIENGRLMFNNSSIEEGDHLRDELAPQTYRIRQNIGNLLEELYNIK